jgi:hypothetical protein
VLKRDPLQIRAHLRPRREPLAPEPQALVCPRGGGKYITASKRRRKASSRVR